MKGFRCYEIFKVSFVARLLTCLLLLSILHQTAGSVQCLHDKDCVGLERHHEACSCIEGMCQCNSPGNSPRQLSKRSLDCSGQVLRNGGTDGASCVVPVQCKDAIVCMVASCAPRLSAAVTHDYLVQQLDVCFYGTGCTVGTFCNETLTCVSKLCNCPHGGFSNFTVTPCLIKNLGEDCVDSSQCQGTLTCVSKKCGCTSNQYFDSSDARCLPRKTFGSDCTNSSECQQTLTCLPNSCSCKSFEDYNSSTSQCQSGKSHGSSCSNSRECQRSLTCVSSECGCTPDQYYDADLTLCNQKKSFGGECADHQQCNTTFTCLANKCDCSPDQVYNTSDVQCRSLSPPSESDSDNSSVAIGVGVGCALIVLLVVILILIFLYKRKTRARKEKVEIKAKEEIPAQDTTPDQPVIAVVNNMYTEENDYDDILVADHGRDKTT